MDQLYLPPNQAGQLQLSYEQPWDDEYNDFILGCMHHYEHKIRVQLLENQWLDEDNMQNNWHLFLPMMSKILKTFKRHQFYYQENNIPNKSISLFSLLPMYSFKQKHVHISNSALKQTLQNLHLPNDIQNPEDPNDPLPLWNHYFHIERLTTANRRFGCSIKTDGVKCAVSFLKPKPEPLEFNLF